MNFQFKEAGGRLLRIAFIFAMVCVFTIVVMSYFLNRALADVKEIALTKVSEGEKLPEVQGFYVQIINNLDIGSVIASLAGVLIAIAARYGLRETAQNIFKPGTAKPPEEGK